MGYIPLENLDLVVDPKTNQVMPNPENGGKYTLDLLWEIRVLEPHQGMAPAAEMTSDCVSSVSTSVYASVLCQAPDPGRRLRFGASPKRKTA